MAPHKQERRQRAYPALLAFLDSRSLLMRWKLHLAKRQSTTQGSAISHQPAQEQFVARRIKSHLADLEKDNYIKPGGGNILRRNEDDEEEQKSGEILIARFVAVGAESVEILFFGSLIVLSHVRFDSFTAAGSSPSKLRASSSKQKQKKTSANVRQLLMYRKNLETLIIESVSHHPRHLPSFSSPSHVNAASNRQQKLSPTPSNPNYLTAQTVPSVYPPKKLCSICGYKVKYACVRCGSAVCDIGCRDVHDESRCERRS